MRVLFQLAIPSILALRAREETVQHSDICVLLDVLIGVLTVVVLATETIYLIHTL